MKYLILILLVCGSAHSATDVPKSNKEQSKNESLTAPNPITHYVNVCQQGEGKDAQFIVCDRKSSSCVQEKHTPKNLANAK